MISDKANRIGASPTFKVAAKAKAMKAEGIDVVDLSLGEPDFPTPENVKAAGIKAIQDNFTKYTENEGMPALKKAIIGRLKEDYGLTYAPNEVIVSTGPRARCSIAFQAADQRRRGGHHPRSVLGDLSPSRHAGQGKIRHRPDQGGERLRPDARGAQGPHHAGDQSPPPQLALESDRARPTRKPSSKPWPRSSGARTSSSSPTRSTPSSSTTDSSTKSFASLGEDIKKKTILINGVSKAYSMTGWRIGYAAGPAAADRRHGPASRATRPRNPTSISQKASVEALGGPQAEVSRMVAEFERRRNYCPDEAPDDPAAVLFQAPGRLLSFPQRPVLLRPGIQRHAHPQFLRDGLLPAPGSPGGHRPRRRLRRRRLHPALLRHVDGEPGKGAWTGSPRPWAGSSRPGRPSASPSSNVRHPGPRGRPRRRRPAAQRSATAWWPRPRRGSPPTSFFEWNANIDGVIVRSGPTSGISTICGWRTGRRRQLDADIEPHGIIYAVDGIAGPRAPRVLQHRNENRASSSTSTPTARSGAWPSAWPADVAERHFGVHLVRGMSLDSDGRGLASHRAAGDEKDRSVLRPAPRPEVPLPRRATSSFVRSAGKAAQADAVERKAYLPTNTVEAVRTAGPSLRPQQVRKRRRPQGRLPERRMSPDGGLPARPRLARSATRPRRTPTPCSIPTGSAGPRPRRADDPPLDLHPPERRDLAVHCRGRPRGRPPHLRSGRNPGDAESADDGPPPPFFNPHLLVATEDTNGPPEELLPEAPPQRGDLSFQQRRGRDRKNQGNRRGIGSGIAPRSREPLRFPRRPGPPPNVRSGAIPPPGELFRIARDLRRMFASGRPWN